VVLAGVRLEGIVILVLLILDDLSLVLEGFDEVNEDLELSVVSVDFESVVL
jgi:hypothetical protein